MAVTLSKYAVADVGMLMLHADAPPAMVKACGVAAKTGLPVRVSAMRQDATGIKLF